MIILRQKEFNSKAQKAMRRKWDLEQGMKANDLHDGRYLGLDTLETDARLAKARDQYLDYGTKKTNELIGKAQKHVKHPGIVIGLNSNGQTIITSDKSRTPVVDISDKEEKEKAENAIKLLQAGRARSRSINKYKTGNEFENRSMINRLDEKITKNKGADSGKTALGAKNRMSEYDNENFEDRDLSYDFDLRREIRDRKKTAKNNSQQSQNSQPHPKQEMPKSKSTNILKRVGNLYTGKSKYGKKGQAIAIGGTLGTAALVGGGIAIKKARDKKKKKESEEKKDK